MHPAALWFGAVAMSLGTVVGQAPPLVVPETPATALPFPVETPPPAWIAPGLRLSFHTLAGTLPAGEHEFEIDPEGRWVDAGGNRYKRTEVGGTGSVGFLQANVVAMADKKVAMQMLFYLCDGGDETAPIETTEFGNVVDASCGGDLWLHPDRLQRLLAEGAQGLVVRRIDHTIDQVTYRAVLLFWPRAGGRSVWIYDLDSGVLLYASDIAKSGRRMSRSGEQLSAGASVIRFTVFRASRQIDTPWAKQPVPPAVLQARGFDFRGRLSVRPVATDTALPFDLRFDVTQRGDDWFACKLVAADTMPGFETRVRSNHLLTGLWVPPAACEVLQSGQVLDRDPVTKVTVSVAHTDAEHVVLLHQNPRQEFRLTYRKRDGLLVRGDYVEHLSTVPGGPALRKVVELELVNVR